MQPSSSINDLLSRDTVATSESLSAMMQKEQSTYRSCDYLHPSSLSAADAADIITESDRLKIVDWCYSVIDQCKFDRETVAMAIDVVDRFLSRPSDIAYRALRDRTQFQLLAMSALYIAIKINEKLSLGSDFFAAMSRGVYSVEDIEAMELAILKGLSWRIHAPTSVQMAHHVLSLVYPHVALQESTWGFILDEVRFQTEHSVRDYYLSSQRPSTVTMAAILNTLDQVDRQDRQAILHALLLVVNREFDSPELLMIAKNRLQCLVGGHQEDDDEEEDDEEEDDSGTVVSASSREVGADSCFPIKRRIEEEHVVAEQTSPCKKIPRTSPQTVGCSRRESGAPYEN